MIDKNLLVISNNFPNEDSTYTKGIFIKEQLNYLKDCFNNVYVISPVAYGIERLRRNKYENYSFDNVKIYFPKYLNFPFFYYYGRGGWLYLAQDAIFKFIKKENIKFDLIHAHFTWPSGALAVGCKKMYKVPLVITEHTSITFKKAIANRNHYSIKSWELSDAIIRVREGDISDFGKVGINPQKVSFIPNGFDARKFHPMNIEDCKRKLGLPMDKKIILCIANFNDKVKGQRYLVEAVAKIIKNRQDVLVLLLGSGNLERIINKQICTAGLEEYFKLVGGKSHDEIPLWMNVCNLFVLPSLNESFGVVLVEAMACGKPLIGTRVGGIPEIITSSVYGLLVEPADSKDLAEKILLGLDRGWDKEKIIAYAERYRWERVAQEIMDVYTQVLTRG